MEIRRNERSRAGRLVARATPALPAPPPRRDPISGKLDVRWCPTVHEGAVARVLQLMDLGHDEGGLRPGSVVQQRPWMDTSSYDPVSREIKLVPTTDAPHYETAHEGGHWIDHGNSGNINYRASEQEDSPAMNAWRETVKRSNAGRLLRDKANANPSNDFLQYARTFREVWARSYAQWLALRTGDPALRRDLDTMRQSQDPRIALLHWTDEDFAAISEAIDAVLQARDWLP